MIRWVPMNFINVLKDLASFYKTFYHGQTKYFSIPFAIKKNGKLLYFILDMDIYDNLHYRKLQRIHKVNEDGFQFKLILLKESKGYVKATKRNLHKISFVFRDVTYYINFNCINSNIKVEDFLDLFYKTRKVYLPFVENGNWLSIENKIIICSNILNNYIDLYTKIIHLEDFFATEVKLNNRFVNVRKLILHNNVYFTKASDKAIDAITTLDPSYKKIYVWEEE